MKLRLIARMAGPEGNHAPGSVIDLPDAKATALVAGGYAVCLEEPKTIEAEPADVPAEEPESPVRRTRRKAVND